MNIDQYTLELCRYRSQQADEALDEAEILQDAGYLRGALNRAYYAMFYELQVLIIQKKVRNRPGRQ